MPLIELDSAVVNRMQLEQHETEGERFCLEFGPINDDSAFRAAAAPTSKPGADFNDHI